ncbi:MAG: S8 family serine peptidase, partial [Thermoleophilaceae bacterium]|nr:S8 family serine peptidase [Thermoleophilaceae bacterium]
MASRGALATLFAVALGLCAAPAAQAAFPYPGGGAYNDLKLPTGANQQPNEMNGGKLQWMYSATPDPDPQSQATVNQDPKELNGVRGAHIADSADVDTAWRSTTGRPDVTIAVLDSGIKWDDAGAMADLRKKTRLTKAELPVPLHDRPASLEAGEDCSTYQDRDDANGDGVFNVVDFSCDTRVERDPAQRGGKGVGPANVLDPQDVLIAFSNGSDADNNGFKDDIVGWDFLDDDNDPYDDVQYGHGTGEARDSTAEANNGGELGSCPNCMSIHMRVGDSFVADVNRFAQATIYAADNDVEVVQEALGTLNNSNLARNAVRYAYDHGVVVMASAADEAAQHHNWPSTLPGVIQVNSITKFAQELTPLNRSYLQFNGCTNFMSKITVGIPSVSCSSDAVGRASGMAGLIYSAAFNARENGNLADHPTCRRTDGSKCRITPNEVRQLMASGELAGVPQADDVNFATQPEGSCTPPTALCTDPNLNAGLPSDRTYVSPVPTTRRYPTRKGFDNTFGYGRVNMNSAVDRIQRAGAAQLPPEVEITSPEWYAQIDPENPSLAVRAELGVRAGTYKCEVHVAPGSQPNNRLTTDTPGGDFKKVASTWCDGTTPRTGAYNGVVANLDLADLRSRFPATAGNFDAREPGIGAQTSSGRPSSEPYGFTVRVVAKQGSGANELTGQDRRNMSLHRDADMLPGFPKQLPADGASSPLLVDIDGDNRNELLVATSDGIVHAYKPDGSEAAGWPVRGDSLPLHGAGRAFQSGDIADFAGGAILASLAAADADRDGSPEIYAADLEGKVYGWDAEGDRVFEEESNPAYSGKPLSAFNDVRKGSRNRTQHGFIGSPVLADLDRNDGGRLEVIVAGMDRHVYAWNDSGSDVDGFPKIVVDQSKVASIDPQTHAVTFNANAGTSALNQGSIVSTPAVGDIDQPPDGKPEIVVGTNEEYATGQGNEGDFNASNFNAASVAALAAAGGFNFGGQDNPLDLGLASANSRLFALENDGDPKGGGSWPAKIGLLQPEILPVVGEGITGAPSIGPALACPNGGQGRVVAVSPGAGPGYVLNRHGQSCAPPQGGKDTTLATDVGVGGAADKPTFAAFGHPAFGDLGGPSASVLMPTSGIQRALDVAFPEYQGGQDSLTAWDPATGQARPGFPAAMNDLQFLTGPSIGDIDGLPGEEILAASASQDLQAFTAAGTPVSAAWPKLTADWTVANPLLGSFGTLDTDAGAKRRVVTITRSGILAAYETAAPACAAASWPRFHHDNANSGDYDRDAVAPGKPYSVGYAAGKLSLKAPGDDGLCGEAGTYELATSDSPITRSNFDAATPLANTFDTPAAGTDQSLTLPAGTKRYVALRARDEQGNLGLPAVVDTGSAPVPETPGNAPGGQPGA